MTNFISDGETAIPVSKVHKIVEQRNPFTGSVGYVVHAEDAMLLLDEGGFARATADRIPAAPGWVALSPYMAAGELQLAESPVIAWAVDSGVVTRPIALDGFHFDSAVGREDDPRVWRGEEVWPDRESFRKALAAEMRAGR